MDHHQVFVYDSQPGIIEHPTSVEHGEEKREKTMGRCCIVSIAFSLIISVLLSVLLSVFLFGSAEPNELAMCGNCHCIVSSSATESNACPTEKPKTEYSAATIEALRHQRPLNPYELKCDPYDNESCQLNPPQDDTVDLGESAVCGLVYQAPLNGDSELASGIFDIGTVKNAEGEIQQQDQLLCPDAPQEYLMVSYPNEEAALSDGAIITHLGSCGACSTTQDLAAYLTTSDLTTASKECIKRSILNQDEGIKCLENDIGFTNACANIWLYNGENTGQKCTLPCAAAEIQNYAHNGPSPECPLNGCLACAEEQSGPIFRRFAGRTRQRSGLLTTIARPCEDTAMIDHEYACPSQAKGEYNNDGGSIFALAAATSSF